MNENGATINRISAGEDNLILNVSFSAGGMKVVHCKKDKFDVYIGRPSKWGNPYVIGVDGDRKEVIRKYGEYVLNNKELMGSLHELKGKTLGCWCSPLACHGDVLVKLVTCGFLS